MEWVRAGGRRHELDNVDHLNDHLEHVNELEHVNHRTVTAEGYRMSPEHVFDIVAVICFAIAAIPWPPQPPLNLTALGLVFFTLAHLVAGGPITH